MEIKHGSASSFTKFAECPANWAVNYDQERKVTTRSDRTDIGNLVHGAAEEWRNPNNGLPRTFEALEECFDRAAVNYVFAEPLDAYKRGKELLAALYRMTQHHPTIPVHLLETIGVEVDLLGPDGELWRMDGWPLPIKGQLDHIGIIRLPNKPSNHIVLFTEDYKTGRPKSHAELVENDIQPSLYLLWVRDVLVPHLEEQGYVIERIIGSWTYVSEGVAVPLYESDFDHDLTRAYVGNIQAQIIEFQERYNEFTNEQANKYGDLRDPSMQEEIQGEYNAWLSVYEKPNQFCPYCPRKRVCQTFTRLLTYDAKVDIVGPDTNWKSIYEELVAYQTIEKNAKDRVSEIKGVIPLYLDEEGLDAIPLPELGVEIVANQETRKRYRMKDVADILGEEFVIENATITDTAIKKKLDFIAVTDSEQAKTMETLLQGAYVTIPGPRPVRTRKLKPTETKGKKSK